MFSILLFIFYVFLLTMLLVRFVKVKQIAIKSSILIFAFFFKVLLGCIYGYVFLKYYGGDDTWLYHNVSLIEYRTLLHNPGVFFKDFLPLHAFEKAHSFFEGIKIYVQELEYCLRIKPLAIFNIFSRGNYYINVVFFNFFTFAGPLLLFRLLNFFFPEKRTVFIIAIFFIPNISFWLSGIRAEALLLLFFSISLYYYYKWSITKKIINPILSLFGLAGMLVLRPEFLFVFIPSFIALTLTLQQQGKTFRIYLFSYLTFIVLFFGSLFISEKNNFPAIVAERQHDFFQLHGNTVLHLDTLQPTLTSFLVVLPQAASNTFFHPLLWEAKGVLQIFSALDVIAFWILILLVIFRSAKNWKRYLLHPIILLFLFYGIIETILIGYIVPFPGAIVRYKVIPELLLILVCASIIDWKRLLTNNIKK
jgi:hypothetical protein